MGEARTDFRTGVQQKTSDVYRPTKKSWWQRIPLTKIAYAFILAWFTIILMTPIIWLVASSFKTNSAILSASSFFPQEINLRGYQTAFSEVGLHRFFINSFIISTASTLSVLTVATLAAYPLARFDFRGRGVLTTIFSLGIVVPITSLIVPEIVIMTELGLRNTREGLILLYTALFFPISFLVMRAFFLSIPREIEEAAMIDGANYFTILRRVILPISGPGLSTVGVMVFVWTWNEFLYALLMISSAEQRTVQVAIRFFTSQFDFNYPGMFAAVTMVMVVPIIIFLLLQERVISGLTAGATKL